MGALPTCELCQAPVPVGDGVLWTQDGVGDQWTWSCTNCVPEEGIYDIEDRQLATLDLIKMWTSTLSGKPWFKREIWIDKALRIPECLSAPDV